MGYHNFPPTLESAHHILDQLPTECIKHAVWCLATIEDGFTLTKKEFPMKVLNAKEKSVEPPHPHAALMEAYQKGAAIQFYSQVNKEWTDTALPTWSVHRQYRIKPGYRYSYRTYERKLKNSFDAKLLPVVCVCMDKTMEQKIEGLTGFVKWLEPWKDVYEEA